MNATDNSYEQFMQAWALGKTRYPVVSCTGTQLYRAYDQYCKENRIHCPSERDKFVSHICRHPLFSNKRQRLYDNERYIGKGSRKHIIMIDPTAYVSAAPEIPRDKIQTQWLTDCYFLFEKALLMDEKARCL